MSTIKQYETYSEINEVITKKIIAKRREAMGAKSNNISTKAALIMNNIFKVIRDTGINEVTMSLSDLKKVLKVESTKNIARDMKTYFRGYGIGDFASTKKSKIFKIIHEGKLSNDIKSEITYVFYINEETLQLMKKNNLCNDLDYDKLINDIPESIEVLKEVGGKSATEIVIRNYVDESYFIDTTIKVNKNLVKQEGTFEKKVDIHIDGEVIERTNIKEEFVPKECDNPIIDRLEEISTKKVEEEISTKKVEKSIMSDEEIAEMLEKLYRTPRRGWGTIPANDTPFLEFLKSYERTYAYGLSNRRGWHKLLSKEQLEERKSLLRVVQQLILDEEIASNPSSKGFYEEFRPTSIFSKGKFVDEMSEEEIVEKLEKEFTTPGILTKKSYADFTTFVEFLKRKEKLLKTNPTIPATCHFAEERERVLNGRQIELKVVQQLIEKI